MTANGIRHTRVAPYHPSSNGLAERAVGTLKNGLKTAGADVPVERALARFLLAYRSSPHAVTGRTPAELLYGRNLRTRLNLLVPCATTTLEEARDDQRRTAGGQAREFRVGAPVWVRSYGGRQKWIRGTVVTRIGPVSYEVDVGDAVWSRHVDQLVAAGGQLNTGGNGPERAALPARPAPVSGSQTGPVGGAPTRLVGGTQTGPVGGAPTMPVGGTQNAPAQVCTRGDGGDGGGDSGAARGGDGGAAHSDCDMAHSNSRDGGAATGESGNSCDGGAATVESDNGTANPGDGGAIAASGGAGRVHGQPVEVALRRSTRARTRPKRLIEQ